jgi:UDP-glucose 4-epimerase
LIVGDIRDRDAVATALEGVDAVFHLAAKVTIRGSFDMAYEDADVNLMGTMNILRSVRAERVKRFVLASSMGIYADSASPEPIGESHPQQPIAPYGVGKLAAEQMSRLLMTQAGVPFTAFRYFNTFGPGQAYTPYVGVITIFITKLLAGQAPVIFGDGEQCRDFVHVDDIAAGTASALDGPPGTYNLGTGRATSLNRLAQLLIEKTGSAAKVTHGPAHPGELRYSIADISAARTALGYQPRRTLDDSIEGVIEWIRAGRQLA